MIVDVDVNTLKKLGMKTEGFIMYEGSDTFELYYVNKGPVIFRSIVKKDKNALAFLRSIGTTIKILNPIKDNDNSETLKKIEKKLDDIFLALRIGR